MKNSSNKKYKYTVIKILRLFPRLKNYFYIFWNRIYFSISAIEFGRNMKVKNKVYVTNMGHVSIGDDFIFSSGDNINSVSRNICGSIHVMSDDAIIIIGDNVGISSACIRAMSSIIIGDNVNIGADCLIMDTDSHPHDYRLRLRQFENSMKRSEYIKLIPKAPIIIEDNVWIGARCQVLKGVHIGARSIIASGSIVTRNIPSDCIAAGNPAKVIKKLKTL